MEFVMPLDAVGVYAEIEIKLSLCLTN
jgi:hypothetical protein